MPFTIPGAHYRRASLLLTAALLLPTLAARAPRAARRDLTTVIVGRITDAGGKSIAQAIVSIADRSLSATSGTDGRYTLQVTRRADVEPVLLSVRRIGYERRYLRVALRGDTVRVDVQLSPASTQLQAQIATPAPIGPVREYSLPTTMDAAKRAPAGGDATMRASTRRARPAIMGASVGVYAPTVRIKRDDPRYIARPQLDSGNTEAYDHIDENTFRSPLV